MALKAWWQYSDWNNFMQLWNGAPINGDDIAMPQGTPITTPFSGTITRRYQDDSGGIVIVHADNPNQINGLPYYYFCHLDTFNQNLQVGSHVSIGDLLGTSGGQNTGGTMNASPQWSTGPHIMAGLSDQNAVPVGNAVKPNQNFHPIFMILQQSGGVPTSNNGQQTLDYPGGALNPINDYNSAQTIQNFVNALLALPTNISKWGQAAGIFLIATLLIILGIILLAGPENSFNTASQAYNSVSTSAKKGQKGDKKKTKAPPSKAPSPKKVPSPKAESVPKTEPLEADLGEAAAI